MRWRRPAWLHRPRSRGGRIAAWVLLVLLVVVLVWIVIARLTKKKDEPPPPPPPPVTIAAANAAAVPIILRGLGQVQAFNTYTARSRVDGNITQIGYREGSEVRAGDLLVRVDPRPYRAMLEDRQASRARDEAQLANARLDLQRYAALLPDGLASKQDYDRQVATVRQLAATVRSDSAQVDQARINLGYTAIRAPFAGRIGERMVDIGNLVGAGSQTALVVLTQTRPIFVAFTLPELDIDEVVQALHRGPVRVDAYDRDDRQRIAGGTLEVLDNRVDTGSGTVALKARFANDDERLWPGEFVNAHIVTAVREHGITIPAGAVQMGPNGRFVFRLAAGDRVQVAPVQVGQIEHGSALVETGLTAGDRVVVDGAFGLSPGDRVRVAGRGGQPTGNDTLGLTGRTKDVPAAAPGGGQQSGADKQKKANGPKEEQPPPKQSASRQPTEQQTPQRQTPSGGRELNGTEGPGARTPLPDTRQVPEPPSTKADRKQQQGRGNGR